MGAGGGTLAEQTAAIMIGFEKELLQNAADLVMSDVTSTMACAITTQKLHTKVAHVQAGIRSGDWTILEEINRFVTCNKPSILKYYGRVNDKDKLLSIYRVHQVIEMASKHQTFGLVFIEALLQVLLILYTRNEGFDGM